MKYTKVLLINPGYSRTYFTLPVLPAGLGYLSESLRQNGLEYNIFDMSLGYSFAGLKKKIDYFKPQLIGISCISYMLKNTYRMVSGIKRLYPGITIVLGGPHASSVKEKALRECAGLDFVLSGEGEFSLIDICKGQDPKKIKGLAYRIDSKEVSGVPNDFIEDLDGLGFPKYRGFELDRYGYKMIGIVTSRGCPYSCIYCSCNVIGKKIRFRSPQSIINEIGYWYDKGYREFGIQEDNPTFDRKRMLEICDSLIKQGFRDLKLMCGNGVRADRVDRELLEKMKEAGFKRLAFGIESGSDNVLAAIKKGATVSVMDKAIKEASELGFFVSLFFLVGSPQETAEDVEKSIQLALKYPVQYADFFNLIPLPGSELYNWVKTNRYFVRHPDEYLNARYHPARSVRPVFETPEFPRAERARMLKKTRKVTKKIKRDALLDNFPKLGAFGKALFWVYCTDQVENLEKRMLANEFLRKTIGKFRMNLRNIFYK